MFFKKFLIGCLVLITISIGIFGKTTLPALNQIYEDKLDFPFPVKEYLIENPKERITILAKRLLIEKSPDALLPGISVYGILYERTKECKKFVLMDIVGRSITTWALPLQTDTQYRLKLFSYPPDSVRIKRPSKPIYYRIFVFCQKDPSQAQPKYKLLCKKEISGWFFVYNPQGEAEGIVYIYDKLTEIHSLKKENFIWIYWKITEVSPYIEVKFSAPDIRRRYFFRFLWQTTVLKPPFYLYCESIKGKGFLFLEDKPP